MEYTKQDRSSWTREQLENELDGALKLYQIAMKQYKNDQDEITRLQSLTQWVRVDDHTPVLYQEVLVCNAGNVTLAEYRSDQEWYSDSEESHLYKVTHWMPLPLPPEGVK